MSQVRYAIPKKQTPVIAKKEPHRLRSVMLTVRATVAVAEKFKRLASTHDMSQSDLFENLVEGQEDE